MTKQYRHRPDDDLIFAKIANALDYQLTKCLENLYLDEFENLGIIFSIVIRPSFRGTSSIVYSGASHQSITKKIKITLDNTNQSVILE